MLLNENQQMLSRAVPLSILFSSPDSLMPNPSSACPVGWRTASLQLEVEGPLLILNVVLKALLIFPFNTKKPHKMCAGITWYFLFHFVWLIHARRLPCTSDQELGFNLNVVFPNEANQGLCFTCPDTWVYFLALDYVFPSSETVGFQGCECIQDQRSPGWSCTCSSPSTAQDTGSKEEIWVRATFWHIESSWKMFPEIKVGQGMGQGCPCA